MLNYDAIPLEGQDYLTPEEKEKLAAQKAERDQKIFDEANSGPNAAAQSTSTPPVEASDSTEPAKSKPAEPRFDPASFVGGTSTGIDPFGEEDTIDAETAKEKSIQGLEGVAAIPMGAIDFGLDVVGTVPGLGGVDDWWDETTKFSSPVTQNVRSLASVIVPTMYLGPLGGGAATAGVMRVGLGGSKIAKGLASVTGYAMTDAAVTGFSDYSERDEGLMKGLDEFLDSIGNPLGMNIPDAMKVMDGDDPTVRRQKLMFETAGLSIVGDVLGYALSGGKPIMNWFKPKDDVAKQYKAAQSRVNPDEFTVKATAELDKGIYEAEQLGQTDVALSLTRDRDRAIGEYLDSGMSEYTLDPLESYVGRQQASREWQMDVVGEARLSYVPEDQFDPFINSRMSDEASKATFSIPNGSVARNLADNAAISRGISGGSPAPILSESAYQALSRGDISARAQIKLIADEVRRTGDFDAVVENVRLGRKEMDDAMDETISAIIEAENKEQLEAVLANTREMRKIAKNVEVAVLSDADYRPVKDALVAISDYYLNEDVLRASAQVVLTEGNHVQAIAQSLSTFKGKVDPDRAHQIMFDKLGVLMKETGLNKHLSGRGLGEKGFAKRVAKDPQTVLAEFKAKEAEINANVDNFIANLSQLREFKPEVVEALVNAYKLSDGKVNTLEGLNNWAMEQVKPGGLIYSDKGMNQFVRGLASYWYSNILGVGSAAMATVSNAGTLILKPFEWVAGVGTEVARTGDLSLYKEGLYAFQVERETVLEALGSGWKAFIQASKDPYSMQKLMREDFNDTALEQFKLL